MAETIVVSYASQLTIAQTFDTTAAPASTGGGATITHDQWNTTVTTAATASSGIPEICTKCASFSQALSSGTATIDLTSLTGTNGAAVTFNGLKVQFARFQNPSSNANAITITEGASNGYELGGSSFSWILQPGQEITIRGYEATPEVSASTKTIDLSGTGAQALRVQLAAG